VPAPLRLCVRISLRLEEFDVAAAPPYPHPMKVKTSVALSKEILVAIDRRAGRRGSRSAVIEMALRSYLRPARETGDLEIINRHAKHLNREARDVLGYQVIP
jgi:Arc/MetJ-type ribon-helix-helix transcriptional regulator